MTAPIKFKRIPYSEVARLVKSASPVGMDIDFICAEASKWFPKHLRYIEFSLVDEYIDSSYDLNVNGLVGLDADGKEISPHNEDEKGYTLDGWYDFLQGITSESSESNDGERNFGPFRIDILGKKIVAPKIPEFYVEV